MGLFRKEKNQPQSTTLVDAQRTRSNPFGILDRYTPLCTPDAKLYSALREAVPIIDAAIFKITRLIGGFKVVCDDENAQNRLEHFLKTVPVSGTQTGIDSFVSTYFEQLLTFGTAVGEIVLNNRKIVSLYNAPLDNIELCQGETALTPVVCTNTNGTPTAVKYPELILLSVLNPDAGSLKGNSLLKGLAFVSSVLMKIYNTIGLNFERVGNLRFAVTYKPQSDALDKAHARENAQQIAEQWRKAMQSGDKVKDFICVGDVDIKVIGADNQVLDTEVPVRQILEQIIAKTGLPPFMLGLSWSSTERMSKQQADMLTSELEAYRRILSPVINRISETWLKLNGFNCSCNVEWDEIMLQDELELAQARLYRAQAQELERADSNEKMGGDF